MDSFQNSNCLLKVHTKDEKHMYLYIPLLKYFPLLDSLVKETKFDNFLKEIKLQVDYQPLCDLYSFVVDDEFHMEEFEFDRKLEVVKIADYIGIQYKTELFCDLVCTSFDTRSVSDQDGSRSVLKRKFGLFNNSFIKDDKGKLVCVRGQNIDKYFDIYKIKNLIEILLYFKDNKDEYDKLYDENSYDFNRIWKV